MGQSKNHHYIPKSILRQFCFSGNSILLYDAMRPENGYHERNIDRAFQKFHGNSFKSSGGQNVDYVEKWLAKEVDDPLGRVLAAAARDLTSIFEPSSKLVLAKYMITLLFRAPRGRGYWLDGIEPYTSLSASIFDLAKMLGAKNFRMFDGHVPGDFAEALGVIIPTLVDETKLGFLIDSELTLAVPSGSDVFCLSDFPMMRYDDPRNAIDDIMNEYWFVLGPQLAACFVANSKLTINGSILPLPDSYVRRINFDFAMRSQFVASNCPVQLHRTVRRLGTFPSGRLLDETTPEMFIAGGKFF